MELIKIKFVQAMIIGCLFSVGYSASYANAGNPFIPNLHYLAEEDGSIVMEDDVMLVDTNTPNDSILRIEIFSNVGEKVREITDCLTFQCSVDLSDLLPGQYFVNVSTVSGNAFSDFIDVE